MEEEGRWEGEEVRVRDGGGGKWGGGQEKYYRSAMVMEDVQRTIIFDIQRQAVPNHRKHTTGSGCLRMSSSWKTYTSDTHAKSRIQTLIPTASDGLHHR